jgi:hypothetical protein
MDDQRSRQWEQMPVISTTGDLGVNPACFAAALRLCPTAADAASPTAPHVSQIRNTTGAPDSCLGEPVHDLVGAERLVAGRQHLQHLPAHGGQPLRPLGAARLGMRQGVAGAARVVVAGRGEDFGHQGAVFRSV